MVDNIPVSIYWKKQATKSVSEVHNIVRGKLWDILIAFLSNLLLVSILNRRTYVLLRDKISLCSSASGYEQQHVQIRQIDMPGILSRLGHKTRHRPETDECKWSSNVGIKCKLSGNNDRKQRNSGNPQYVWQVGKQRARNPISLDVQIPTQCSCIHAWALFADQINNVQGMNRTQNTHLRRIVQTPSLFCRPPPPPPNLCQWKRVLLEDIIVIRLFINFHTFFRARYRFHSSC